MSFRFVNVRLMPGEDVRISLMDLAQKHHLNAASIVSAVGSLTQARLRFANGTTGTKLSGPFEIVSLSGTFSIHGLHMHISVANSQGDLVGGHLMEGCLIHTTLELVILEQESLIFERHLDISTGYLELVVKNK